MKDTSKTAATFTTKLGKTKAGERSRIWIEGERLTVHGWCVGDHFSREWGDHTLTISRITYQKYCSLTREERGTVSGKEDKPIIDITGKVVADCFRGSHVIATYRHQSITFTEA